MRNLSGNMESKDLLKQYEYVITNLQKLMQRLKIWYRQWSCRLILIYNQKHHVWKDEYICIKMIWRFKKVSAYFSKINEDEIIDFVPPPRES